MFKKIPSHAQTNARMKNLLIVFCTISSLFANAQDPFAELEAKHNFRPVMNIGILPGKATTVFPQYIEGKAGLDKFIKAEINYPEAAKEQGLAGRVIISYAINDKGEVVNLSKTKESVQDDVLIDELIRVVQKSGPWIPGKVEDNYEKMKMTVSYEFVL